MINLTNKRKTRLFTKKPYALEEKEKNDNNYFGVINTDLKKFLITQHISPQKRDNFFFQDSFEVFWNFVTFLPIFAPLTSQNVYLFIFFQFRFLFSDATFKTTELYLYQYIYSASNIDLTYSR